jgi:hypothetical protein
MRYVYDQRLIFDRNISSTSEVINSTKNNSSKNNIKNNINSIYIINSMLSFLRILNIPSRIITSINFDNIDRIELMAFHEITKSIRSKELFASDNIESISYWIETWNDGWHILVPVNIDVKIGYNSILFTEFDNVICNLVANYDFKAGTNIKND